MTRAASQVSSMFILHDAGTGDDDDDGNYELRDGSTGRTKGESCFRGKGFKQFIIVYKFLSRLYLTLLYLKLRIKLFPCEVNFILVCPCLAT